MKRILAAILLGLMGTTPCLADSLPNAPGVHASILTGTASIQLEPKYSALTVCQVTGTWSGTLQAQKSLDGTNFYNAQTFLEAGGQVANNQITSNGGFKIDSAGASQVRLSATAWTSGVADVTLRAAPGVVAPQVQFVILVNTLTPTPTITLTKTPTMTATPSPTNTPTVSPTPSVTP